ncbi:MULTISPECIES: response regulator transcription factor [Anaerotruncus]|jgi:DNA-binding response OmpR family regulator|uniref:Stage 0 sporulation protein A homolog n=1 Tax=Anaerotruncus colihominis TaxID=169435 RepID=A0A845SXD4_9FIRM|nr:MULTISPECIES: response regulator transcription factor [Anaerotruncus]MCI8492397.1 response regulator transcription factor [Anaerotruncus sp.]MCR2026234.1 response regulator transcription factor [Anaerotruncus colihominis]NDO38932.1 response regulator transcription factor [Anaerotruncus colihominis]
MRILIIEDDEKLCEAMRFALEREGYTVDVCHDGDNGFRWAREQAHDLILLDRMLPSADGVELLKRLRAQGHTAPVLLVTALGGIGQRVEGLDAGADDYLVKPFAVEELLARVRAMQRRPRQWESARVLQVGDAAFDAAQKTLTGPGGGCSLSKREAALMEILLANHGQTLPRSMLLTRVWGPDAEVEDGNLDNYIHFLRRRLKAAGSTVSIRTVRGVGYQLEDGCV